MFISQQKGSGSGGFSECLRTLELSGRDMCSSSSEGIVPFPPTAGGES